MNSKILSQLEKWLLQKAAMAKQANSMTGGELLGAAGRKIGGAIGDAAGQIKDHPYAAALGGAGGLGLGLSMGEPDEEDEEAKKEELLKAYGLR